MSNIAPVAARAQIQTTVSSTPFNPSSTIASQPVAKDDFTRPSKNSSISSSNQSLKAAQANYNLKFTPPFGGPEPGYTGYYETQSGKTKLSVTAYYDPDQGDKGSYAGNFQSYGFSNGYKVSFFERDQKRGKTIGYIESKKNSTNFDLPENSRLDFSKGISLDKALIISSSKDKNGNTVQTKKTVKATLQEKGVVFSQ